MVDRKPPNPDDLLAARSRLRIAVRDAHLTPLAIYARNEDISTVLDYVDTTYAGLSGHKAQVVNINFSDKPTPLPITGSAIPSAFDSPEYRAAKTYYQPLTEGETPMQPNEVIPTQPKRSRFSGIATWFHSLIEVALFTALILAIFALGLTVLHYMMPNVVDWTAIVVMMLVVWCAYTGSLLARAHTRDPGTTPVRFLEEHELNELLDALSESQASVRAAQAPIHAASPIVSSNGQPDYAGASTAALIGALRSFGNPQGEAMRTTYVTDSERLALAAADRLENYVLHGMCGLDTHR